MDYVVGLKDTTSGRAALRWAVRHARDTGAAVHAVTAFRVPIVWTPEVGPRPEAPAAHRAEARGEQLRAVRAAVGLGHLPVDLSTEVRNGDATAVLVEQSRDADLLVLGAPRQQGLRGLVHRSAARRVAQRARCPVVLVSPLGDATVFAGCGETPAVTLAAAAGTERRETWTAA